MEDSIKINVYIRTVGGELTFLKHNSATLYHNSSWCTLIYKEFGHRTYVFEARNNAGILIGMLAMVRLKSFVFGDYFVSMPYVNYGGAIGLSKGVELALMDEACEFASGIGVRHIEFRDTAPRGELWPVRTDKVVMELELPDSEEALWSAIGSKVRAQVKRPMRESIEILRGKEELVGEFYQVFSRNMRDLGTPVYPRSFFEAIFSYFPENSFITVVRLDGVPVAAGFLLGYKDRLEIPWASSLREYNRVGVNMALYWDVLKFAIEQGYKVFDFGRSTKDCGTYRFKKQWGAKPKQLYWHYWLKDGGELPQLNPNNPKYKIAIKIWQRLPLRMAEWLGPKIVKNLP